MAKRWAMEGKIMLREGADVRAEQRGRDDGAQLSS